MCPVVYLTILGSFLIIFVELVSSFTVTFDPATSNVKEGEDQRVNFTIHLDDSLPPPSEKYLRYEISLPDEEIAKIRGDRIFVFRNDAIVKRNMTRAFVVRGEFMGLTSVKVQDMLTGNFSESKALDVIVSRKMSTISKVFTYSVAILVSLNYINMGCALDMKVVASVIRHPTAPAVGILSQYIIMPVMSFLLGLWLLADATHLKLGLFVFGCSPAGGASNMWTVLLGGNLDLSITMTFISTILATGLLPLWMYTLGKSIYPDTTTMVPVRNILTTLISMAVCLGIGLSFQRFFPRAAAYCKKVLAPVSVAMIIFIIVFGTYANLYMFRLMNAKILFSAGLCVWSGFLGGFIISTVLRFSSKDRTAISVETGIQNTGIAIVLLGVSLPPPYNDIATVVPVAASIMTPLPLTLVWIGMKCISWYKRRQGDDPLRSNDQTRTISNSSSSTLLPTQANGDDYKRNEKVLPAE